MPVHIPLPDKVQKELQKILAEEYPPVQKTLFNTEIIRKARFIEGAYELRDAFDHLAVIYTNSEADVDNQLNEIRTHLRRISVEADQYVAEFFYIKTQKILMLGTWWWRLLWLYTPEIEPSTIRTNLKRIKDLITEGRTLKASKQAKEPFVQAARLSQSTYQAIKDAEIPAVIGAVLFAIISAGMSWFLVWSIRALWNVVFSKG